MYLNLTKKANKAQNWKGMCLSYTEFWLIEILSFCILYPITKPLQGFVYDFHPVFISNKHLL